MRNLTKKQQKEIELLAEMPDSKIDTSDTPEMTHWDQAVAGQFYRPVKKQVTLRLDADLLEWFRSQGNKYQTRINQALREYVNTHRKAG